MSESMQQLIFLLVSMALMFLWMFWKLDRYNQSLKDKGTEDLNKRRYESLESQVRELESRVRELERHKWKN